MVKKVNQGSAENPKQGRVISLQASLHASSTTSVPTLWLTASFAQKWFEDALNEARMGIGPDSRRREIVFAVCFAESYLIEWVRDDVFKKDPQQFIDYLDSLSQLSARRKWVDIPDDLFVQKKLIPRKLDRSKSYWKSWNKLVDYRDGLVHARASRPDGLKKYKGPLPTLAILEKMQPGEPTRIVRELVKHLNQITGTFDPSWLVDP